MSQHYSLRVHSCCHKGQECLLFKGWIIFHCLCVFIYFHIFSIHPSTDRGVVSTLWLLRIMQNKGGGGGGCGRVAIWLSSFRLHFLRMYTQKWIAGPYGASSFHFSEEALYSFPLRLGPCTFSATGTSVLFSASSPALVISCFFGY